MGQSTDGILVFGVDIGEHCELPEAWQGYDQEEDDYVEFDLDEYIDEHTGGIPAVELIRHCHHEYMMYILAVPGTYMYANRGYPERVDVTTLEVDPQRIQALNAWIEKNIPGEYRANYHDPSWLLCSMWS